ncbi:hypothetical protein SARC_08110 [Sphaeroforma arctica JP610]|uniref:tRNA/rRNA methyltransferase SpoU type domain-containing protein n=1 Tax=Sphaeroforma arctica JP610 TaxID=667725 RepID=A0A0L0FS22_9EUKA|nr:hypothetical protein SARC_08110 [Sphaeroforma arctica JP610]KNC79504.1 hypothetical protein SARC_08110 [Sphaeroforma arctica JP610]|eukprot:XP_014153406.1 hypothetical protein SARC_08110 [Sphaeroforma arctica JP610]
MSGLVTPTKRILRPLLNVVLVDPCIPQNTGAISRLCAATKVHMIIAGTPKFKISDANLKRAGLDYWEHLSWELQPDKEAFFKSLDPGRVHILTSKTDTPYTHMKPITGDYLFFGSEVTGVPAHWRETHPDRCFTLPMFSDHVRCLNLANTVAVSVYDGLRQLEAF